MEWYIGTEWEQKRKGLRKKVVSLNFQRLEKPSTISTVLINVESVQNLNSRPSKYLGDEGLWNQDIELQMGTAITPIDCYVELLVQQMIEGERAECIIKTKKETSESICFIVKLTKVLQSTYVHKLTLKEVHDLALQYKECGVKMFKVNPIFAQDYFVRAAKCLISLTPFDGLTEKENGVAGSALEALLRLIHTNLAACLLTQKRYEDVIHLTQFVETMAVPPEKGIYRRAMAFFCMKEYELAQRTIERVPDFKEKKEFKALLKRIHVECRQSDEHMKVMMQRLFH